MPDLPILRPAEVIRALERAGFERRRQKGSHLYLVHPDGRRAIVAIHPGDMKRGTLAGTIRQAGLSLDEFLELL